jgi:hypothetical protein
MATMRPTPRNELLGLLSDAYQWMQSPERTQQMQGFAGLLGTTGVPQTVERMAYGEPLTNIGRANVPLLKPETADALMTVAPMAKPAAVMAGRTGRAVGRMAGEEINAAMTGQPTRSLLGAMTPQPMQIVPPSVARQIDMPVNLPTSQEFMTAVKNEPSAQITDEGLLVNLVRRQAPEQSGEESVRTGVFYLPEGQAGNLKHYKGKTGYGGAEPIEGQTLYKNPLFIKGATGGKAPEAAYDSLIGKGAYQKMRADVLKSYGYNSNQSQKVEGIQGILEKYNGLDSDDAYNMAYNIVSNSKSGNTLPYAVQENIVANAVRNAGHDAVLGYGKGRGGKGEFFSEVFDVREQAYPTQQGGYQLMPQFEGLTKPSPAPQQAALDLAQQRSSLLDMTRTPSEAEIKKMSREDLIDWLQNNDPNGQYMDPTPNPSISMYRTGKGYAVENADSGDVFEFKDFNEAQEEFNSMRFSNAEFPPMTLQDAQESAINYLREFAQPAESAKVLPFQRKGLLSP